MALKSVIAPMIHKIPIIILIFIAFIYLRFILRLESLIAIVLAVNVRCGIQK